MNNFFSSSINKLIEEFEKLPSIGNKTAQRLAFHVLNLPDEKAFAFAEAIKEAKQKTHLCSVCCNYTDGDKCIFCSSEKRDKSRICVVEWPKDINVIERTREYKGLYHVLHGALSPMAGVSPGDIKLKELLARIKDGEVKEVILATNSNVEGEATAMYIARLLEPFNVAATRIAHGIPVGGDIEYADEATLKMAFDGRQKIN